MTEAQAPAATRPSWPRALIDALLPVRPIVEEDRVTYHKHWVVLWRSTMLPLFVTLLGAGIWWTTILPVTTQLASTSGWWAVPLGSTAWVVPLGWMWWRYENWRNDIYTITDERMIDVERRPLGFGAQIREAPLRNVQNTTIVIPNVLAASLDFGDVQIDTAGREGQLVFRSVPRPREVVAEVTRRVENARSRQAQAQREQRDAEQLDWLSAYDQLGVISLVKNPPFAYVDQLIDVEWRVAGEADLVATWLAWDVHSHDDRAYCHRCPAQFGGSGNFRTRFRVPEGDWLYVAAGVTIGDQTWWTREYCLPVTAPGRSPE